MKKEWLESYEKEELESARELGEKCISQPVIDTKRMYSDKISFKDVYAYEMGVPLNILLPFYDQVVTELSVPPSIENFESSMRMSVEACASLYKRGRLIPVLTWPRHYENLDYLDPLLELKPPTIARNNALVQLFLIRRGQDPRNAMDFRAEAGKVILGKFEQLANGFREAGIKMDQLYIESNLMDNHVKLKCLGFEGIADTILSLRDHPSMFLNSFTYAMTLAKPIIDSAGGWTQTHENPFAEKIGIKLTEKTVFPVEAGTVLTKKYGLDSILSSDEATLDRLYTETAISKARNLLSELSRAIRTRDENRFASKSAEIDDIFTEARACVDSIGKIQKISGELAIGAIGWFVAGIPGAMGAGLLSHLLRELGVKAASDAVDKAISTVLEPFLKLGFGPLPVSIWRFEEEWSKALSKRPPRP